MAHIEKIKNKSGNIKGYKAIVEIGSGRDRKRKTKTFTVSEKLSAKKAKKKAKTWKAEQIVKREEGTLIDPEDVTVAEYFKHFFKQKKPHIATTTYDNYVRRYECHIKPKIGHFKLQDIKPHHMEEFFSDKRENGRINGSGGLSENTLKKIYVLMNQCFKKAVKFHIIKYNPLTPVEAPSPKSPKEKEVEYMSREEFNKLIKTAKENDYFMYVFIVFILFTGLRKSEAMGLAWDCVDLDNNKIKIKRRMINKKGEGSIIEEATKNEFSKREIKISTKIGKLLREFKLWKKKLRLKVEQEYLGDEYDLVFSNIDGTRHGSNYPNTKIKKLYKKAGLPYKEKIHILRHSFATLNVNNDIKPEIIQNMLGHSRITTTMDIYYHHDTEEQQKAVNEMEKVIEI